MTSGSYWGRFRATGKVVKDLLSESFHATGELDSSFPTVRLI